MQHQAIAIHNASRLQAAAVPTQGWRHLTVPGGVITKPGQPARATAFWSRLQRRSWCPQWHYPGSANAHQPATGRYGPRTNCTWMQLSGESITQPSARSCSAIPRNSRAGACQHTRTVQRWSVSIRQLFPKLASGTEPLAPAPRTEWLFKAVRSAWVALMLLQQRQRKC